MSKTEYAWVIQRDDGLFFTGWEITDEPKFKNDIVSCIYCIRRYCEGSYSIENVIGLIKDQNLQNCRPVKVEIRVVGE